MTSQLRASGLCKTFTDGPPVLAHVSLEVRPGMPLVVVGGAGSGKTTLLRCLAGTYRLDAGSVHLEGDDGGRRIDDADARTRAWLRRDHLGVVDGALIAPPCDGVRETLIRAHGVDAQAEERADGLILRLGLAGSADRPIGLLGAQARRTVAIARQLVRPASVLLLDDPLHGVLPEAVAPLRRLIAGAAGTAAVLLVTAGAEPPELALDHHTMSLIDGVLA